MKKNNWIVYLCIVVFGGLGIYLTFFAGNTSKYDSKTRAYQIDVNERSDSDGSVYYPTYYYRVKGNDYKCESSKGSSSYPDEDKNIVYYDSANPLKCMTEYEKSTSKLAGIICLIATIAIVYFFFIFKPKEKNEGQSNQMQEIDIEKQQKIEANVEKAVEVVGKIQLIFKRVIIGIIIFILLIFILIDNALLRQTIIAKDYIDTTAVFVDRKTDGDSNDYIYTFKDKNGVDHEVTISGFDGIEPEREIKLKYDENNPKNFYEEGSTLDKSGIIWYIVKIVALILLIVLFFNKKLLNKISITAG